jgi:ATP-dependent protease ClpP protease subunit
MILISGHKRFAYTNATPMYHQVSSGAHGKLKEMQEDMIEAERLQKMIESMTLKKTNITKKQLEKVYKAKEDWFMTAEEALKHGVIDEIL